MSREPQQSGGGWTPGPWEAFTPRRSDAVAVRRVEGEARPWEVVHWTGFDASGVYEIDERRANARLIAAAPDLYAACEDALRLPTLVTFSETQSSAHQHSERRADEYARKADAVLDRIRAALLKATDAATPTEGTEGEE